jgi:tetratricopeptide (TPR) repeat protein
LKSDTKYNYGLYGSEEYSPNREYGIIYCDGYGDGEKWKKGTIALFKGEELLFKKKIQRPNDCHVSNDGFIICCDWLNTDKLAGKVFLFNTNGDEIFSKKTTANLGISAISSDSKIALFETYNSDTKDSNQLFLIDIEQKNIFNKFDRPPHPFINAEIKTEEQRIKLFDNKGVIFEIDYSGSQTNSKEYEEMVLLKASLYDKLWLFENKDLQQRLADERYIDILRKALDDRDCCHSFGKEKIFKKIGDYYEGLNQFAEAIDNWKRAIEINPKVGVKRKIELLTKKIS